VYRDFCCVPGCGVCFSLFTGRCDTSFEVTFIFTVFYIVLVKMGRCSESV